MTKKSNESQGHTGIPLAHSPHPALKLRHTLRGHSREVYRMAVSPDGSRLASPSEDHTVQLWDLNSGENLGILNHEGVVVCLAWSPDGTMLATGGGSGNPRVSLWNAITLQPLQSLESHEVSVHALSWSPDGKFLAYGSDDSYIRLWDVATQQIRRELKGHSVKIYGIAWGPDSKRLCSGSWDDTVKLWDAESGENIQTLKGHKDDVNSVAWSQEGHYIASASDDMTVRIWNADTEDEKHILQGHTDRVTSVSFLDSGRLLASLSTSGRVIIWRTDHWTEVLRVHKFCESGILANIAFHPVLPLMAVRGARNEINIWELDFELLRDAESDAPTVFYVNAKVVLLGESGVGKSALGARIFEHQFRPTEGSTHGAQFWHFPTERLPALPTNLKAELTLWDFAGQAEYRLTHQLFLDDTDIALLLFDCSDANDPFRGVPYWAKVLKKHAPTHAKRFLISSRCDVSAVTVDRLTINRLLASYSLDEYFKTSAKTGEGVNPLFQHLMSEIPWYKLPRTSTPELFNVIREFLLMRKQSGANLISATEIREAASKLFTERSATQEELVTVIRLLQSSGLVHRLEPRPGAIWVLLKPERINQYGASIIQAARNHPHGIGAVSERDVLTGDIVFTGFDRLPQTEEALVLEGTAELLIRHDLGFREMGNLVFPSQINVTRHPPEEAHPRTEVAYRFSGSIEMIYASLVVRLNYTNYFRREDQWKYAVEFSRDGNRLGFSMQQVEEGTGELEIYFHSGLSAFDRVTFIRFVTEHLRSKGIDIEEQIRFYCPRCSKEVTNRDAIEARIRDGKMHIPCQFCETAILIPKSIEEIYRRDPLLGEKQQLLAEIVEQRTEAEVERFREDQSQYTAIEDHRIHILHLSDLHLEDEAFADVCRTQLETDLIHELEVARLEYLVISGDIANRSTEQEYNIAFRMVDGLVKRFGLDASRVVVVPGNHDLNWDLSEAAYPFISQRKLPTPLQADRCIPAGDAGALLREDALYRERFANFNTYFYRRVYSGQDFPLDYVNQTLFVERPDDRILFLGLNTSWQLDHHFRKRAGIHMPALTQALNRLQGGNYNNWLKVAVWHHPITGKETMSDDFMQLLAVHGFQVCMHGHIHEANQGFYRYDDRRDIHVIGAGTFGAPANEQVTGIPLQYNLVTFDPQTGVMTVNTRKKEKVDGAWSADARWGDKNNPTPRYHFNVPNFVADNIRRH